MMLQLDEPEVRLDGLDKVTGVARYAADQVVPGALVARYLYATVAHGVVRSIDTTAAERIDGVVVVLTGRDTRGLRAGRRLQDWPLLAWDRVRFLGERVAAVAAETDAAAEDALAAIEVEYEPLPPVFDPEEALESDATVLHPDAATYRFLGPHRAPVGHPNIQGELLVRKGAETDDELERIFETAAHVVEDAFETGRQHQGYIETHGAIVTAHPDGSVHIATTNKAPFSLRAQLSAALDMPVELFDIESGIIGGDFGGKGLSIDEYVLLLLSRRAGRPVRMAATFEEELRSYAPRHGGRIRLRSALDGDGRILAHDADLLFDGGAYAAGKPLPELILPGALDVLAPYDVPAMRIRVRTVYTNTLPGGHMRCPGELQAAFASESHADRLAAAVGLDPIELRRRNVAREGATSAVGERIRQPMAAAVLDALASEAPEAVGPGRGYGVALVARRMEGGRQSVSMTVAPDGGIEIRTGLPDQGAGAHTVMARVAAAALGILRARVRVVRTSTAEASLDLGVGASRVTFIASRAVQDAAARLLAALQESGAGLVPGSAAAGLSVTGSYDSAADAEDGAVDFTYAGLGVVVEVDTGTGQIRIVDAVLAADTGTVINPIAHRGQIEGGFAQGLGAALMEELVIDQGAVMTLNLGDYRLPAATDVPALRLVLLTGAPGRGAFGAKQAGELSPGTVAPAIANAVARAAGVRLRRIPMTAERVLRAIRDGSPDGPPG